MRYEFYPKIKDDRFPPSVTKGILKVIENKNGKTFKVTIEKLSAKRSVAQNNYIHVLFTCFTRALNDLGADYSMATIKGLCKTKFPFYKDVVNVYTGEIIGQEQIGTSEMSKEQISIFIEKIIAWAADTFHIKLPFPNENFEIDFENSDKMFNNY